MLFHSWNHPALPPSHLERGENLKGGGVGGGEARTVLLLFSSMTFTVCGEGMVPFITFQISSLLVSLKDSHSSLYGIVCTFLIHSGILQNC